MALAHGYGQSVYNNGKMYNTFGIETLNNAYQQMSLVSTPSFTYNYTQFTEKMLTEMPTHEWQELKKVTSQFVDNLSGAWQQLKNAGVTEMLESFKAKRSHKPKMVSKKVATDRNAGRLMRKAANVLEDKRWTRGTQVDQTGAMCILGALHYALCGNPKPRNDNALVIKTNVLFTKWHGKPIPVYNDDVARNKDEIVQIMRKFADEFDPQRSV